MRNIREGGDIYNIVAAGTQASQMGPTESASDLFSNRPVFESTCFRIDLFSNRPVFESTCFRIDLFSNRPVFRIDLFSNRPVFRIDLFFESACFRIDLFSNRPVFESTCFRIDLFSNRLWSVAITILLCYFILHPIISYSILLYYIILYHIRVTATAVQAGGGAHALREDAAGGPQGELYNIT
jgi:hypothetical protein